MRIVGRILLAALALAAAACAHAAREVGPASRNAPSATAIVNALVLDGTGAPARPGGVRFAKASILEVGDVRPEPGDEVIDAGGLVLAPGFIDTHSHGDREIFERPDALAAVSQGITTVVVGQDGDSPFPLSEFFERVRAKPAAVNVAAYAGHGTIRELAMGRDFKRFATAAEIERMKETLRREMDAGALGLSSGLEYDPGIDCARAELIELARVAASRGGRYISHIRSEDRDLWDAVDEVIEIGREAKLPVQISHMKLAMRSLWGQARKLLARLDAARAAGVDVTADVYPYTYWSSSLTVMFPKRDFENRETAEFILREIAGPEGLLLGRYKPDPWCAGKTVAQIASKRNTDAATTLIELIRDAEKAKAAGAVGVESVIATSMDEADVDRLLAWPFSNVCTDGEWAGRHPRGYGAFPRVLGRVVRERRAMPLSESIRKMTSLPARSMGLADRGRLAPGMRADLVLFDPATVLDRATTEAPQVTSLGVDRVWVEGSLVYAGGAATGARPGRVLTR